MSYGRSVLLGLLAAGLAALAGAQDWFRLPVDFKLIGPAPDLGADQPLALALALVLLANWGALLLTRGTVRRLLAWLGLVVALAYALTVALAPSQLPATLHRQNPSLADVGALPTGWFVLAALTAVFVLLTTTIAVRGVRGWPEMTDRYDAPGSVDAEPGDLWRALDEGRDPTA